MREDRINISFIAACMEGSLMYGAGLDQNLLFCWNMETKEVQSMGAFQQFGNFHGDTIMVQKYGEQLFFFSRLSYEVVVWNLKEKKFTCYHPEQRSEEGTYIRSVCRVGDEMWMLTKVTDSSVMIFSMKSGRFARHTVHADLEQHFSASAITSFGHENSVVAGSWIWRCVPGTDALLGFDTKSQKTEIVRFHISDTLYTISEKDGWFYVLGVSGKQVIAWNSDTREQKVWDTGYEGISDRPFREVLRAGNRLFLLPCFEDKIACYEIQDNHICLVGQPEYPEEFKKIHDVGYRSLFLGSAFKDRELLYLFPMAGNGMLSLHMDSMRMSFLPIQVKKNDYLNCQKHVGNVIPENQIELQDLLDFLSSEELCPVQNDGDTSSAGKKCWEKVCG